MTVKIGHLIVPTAGMDADLGFYSGFGLTTRFRDSDAYAAVTDGTVTIGLAGEVEPVSYTHLTLPTNREV